MKILNSLKVSHTAGDTDAKAECLWCGSYNLEISNESPHQFQCWSCKKTGNSWTLIQQVYATAAKLKRSQALDLVEKKPGVKATAYRDAGVRSHKGSLIWPNHNTSGSVTSLYRLQTFDGKLRWMSTPKPCVNTLIGLHNLKPEGDIIITEGHWDYAAALSHFNTIASIIGLCGSSFPSKQIQLLENRKVYFLTDNDEAGEQGVNSLAVKMKSAGCLPESLHGIAWDKLVLPSGSPAKGCDVRDLANELC